MTEKLALAQDSNHPQKPWYAKGLHFACTGCGKCCTGGPGYTWVSIAEIRAMAEYLRMTIDTFGKKYLRQIGDRYALLEKQPNYDCVLLNGKQCAVYPVRPTQCQTFPFWPGALRSAEGWKETAASCEGIHDSAPLIALEEIEVQHRRQIQAEQSLD